MSGRLVVLMLAGPLADAETCLVAAGLETYDATSASLRSSTPWRM